MNDSKQIVFTIIAEVLGVEPADIKEEDEFALDLNATPDDLSNMRHNLEDTLDISLPDFRLEPEFTVINLLDMVEDSLL